jgi:hypothetical protein
MPSWCSWDIEIVVLGAEFFDGENTTGYLSNIQNVLEWMEGNPHLPADDSDISYTQASDALLIIGLTYRIAKECANSDPDSPLHGVPFAIPDLEKIQGVIGNMLAQTKKKLKFGISSAIHRAIESSWKKVCLEVGFAESDVKAFGKDWKAFVETYAAVDSALLRSGKPPQLQAIPIFPEALQTWARAADVDGNLPAADKSDWAKEIQDLWGAIRGRFDSAQSAGNLDSIFDEDWCRRGKGGLVCLVLGMKWWRTSLLPLTDDHQLGLWNTVLTDMMTVFKSITQAQLM